MSEEMITARQHLPTFTKVHFSLSGTYNFVEMGANMWSFYPGLLLGNPSRDFPVHQHIGMLALCKREFSV